MFGKIEESIKPGDFITDEKDPSLKFKVKGVEMLHFTDWEKHRMMNPWIVIEAKDLEPVSFIGKTFIVSSS